MSLHTTWFPAATPSSTVMPKASAETPAGAEVQLWEGLGPTSFTITTKDATAQKYFNQGLVFAYGFNHWEAQRAFQAAQKLDPNSAELLAERAATRSA